MMFADSKKRFLLISFALYMFMYMTLLTAINQEASGIVDAGAQLILYYVDMFSVMMGFIIYSLFYDVFKKRDFPLYIAVFNVIILFCTFIVKTEAIFMIMAPIIGLLLGFFGGFFYTFMALSLYEKNDAGMIMDTAMSIAVFFQWLLQIYIGIKMRYIFIIAILVMIFFIMKRDHYRQENPVFEIKPLVSADILPIIIVSGLVFLVFSFDNRMENLLTAVQFKEINIYTWPRLFLIVSYLGFGYVHDRFNGLYDQLSVLMAALFSIISLILLSNGVYINLAMIIFYLELGLLISYYNLVFWKISINRKHLSFWASMGRIIDGGFSIVLALLWKGGVDLYMEIIIDVAVVILIVILIAVENKNRIGDKNKTDLEEFAARYHLTEREKDVFNALLKPEMGVEQMAEELFISRRTLQRHISSIYEKCHVSNRVGLITLVYKK
ncbi:MAG: helix-turn-helix transcriptional regulator [Erysipelotrichaceae bacterium]|nr:helix-turn-helix transcriptional regulator [Erysipelotrichaceae bacterium]